MKNPQHIGPYFRKFPLNLPWFSVKLSSMRLYIAALFICFFSITQLSFAQSNLVDGVIITLDGDTQSVKIKPAKDYQLARYIKIYIDSLDEYQKKSYKDISYFKYDESEFFAKPNPDGKTVFMERQIDGPAELYTYTYKEKKGRREIVTDYYVAKPEEDKFQIIPEKKRTFKSDMGILFEDNEVLADKINDGYYTYDEKEAMVEEYNDWVAQGKPGKTWRQEDGNYTKVDPYNFSNNNQNNKRDRKKPDTPYDGSKFGLEVPLLGNYTLINSDNLVTSAGINNTSGGFGYNLGLGLRWQLSKNLFWRNGFRANLKRFKSNYLATDTAGNNFTVDETGNLHYFGLYSNIHIEFSNFIIGGGFDVSFGSIYRADYSIKDQSGATVYVGEGEPTSIIAEQNGFNAQLDLNLIIGYKFRLANGAFNIKPIFQYSIPLVSMFDVPIQSQPISFTSRSGVYGYTINLGFIIDIGFPPPPKVNSLLDEDNWY